MRDHQQWSYQEILLPLHKMAWYGTYGISPDRRYKRTSGFGGPVGYTGPFGARSTPGSLDKPALPAAESLGSVRLQLISVWSPTAVLLQPPDLIVLLALAGRQKYRTGPRESSPPTPTHA